MKTNCWSDTAATSFLLPARIRQQISGWQTANNAVNTRDRYKLKYLHTQYACDKKWTACGNPYHSQCDSCKQSRASWEICAWTQLALLIVVYSAQCKCANSECAEKTVNNAPCSVYDANKCRLFTVFYVRTKDRERKLGNAMPYVDANNVWHTKRFRFFFSLVFAKKMIKFIFFPQTESSKK